MEQLLCHGHPCDEDRGELHSQLWSQWLCPSWSSHHFIATFHLLQWRSQPQSHCARNPGKSSGREKGTEISAQVTVLTWARATTCPLQLLLQMSLQSCISSDRCQVFKWGLQEISQVCVTQTHLSLITLHSPIIILDMFIKYICVFQLPAEVFQENFAKTWHVVLATDCFLISYLGQGQTLLVLFFHCCIQLGFILLVKVVGSYDISYASPACNLQ